MNCDKTIDLIHDVPVTFEKQNNCAVDWAHRFVIAVNGQTCGKSVFCREGIAQIERIVEDIVSGKGRPGDTDLLVEICAGIQEEADCDLSRKAAGALIDSIQSYREEWETHIRRKRCPASVCRHLVAYYIQGDKCNGCGECAAKCPEKAIYGVGGLIHVIRQDACVKCGECFDVCAGIVGAVAKTGGILPRVPEKPVPVGTWRPGGLGLRKGLRK